MTAPQFQDILEAKSRIDGYVNQTPILFSPVLNELLGANIYIKAESLQPRGSFKIRGATNAILKNKDIALKNGIIAYSSGNHAQGVALACKRIGAKAYIIVPQDVPQTKLQPAKDDGVEIYFYNRKDANREQIGIDLKAKTGAIIIPPYDHIDVIAGQGTIGLEILEFANQRNIKFDYVVTPASGGGLASGIGLVMEELSPQTKIIISEPEAYDDLSRSLELGERVKNDDVTIPSLLDALQAPYSGDLTFPILKNISAKAFGVSDADALKAVKFAFQNFKLVLEPSGASSLALVLDKKIPTEGKNICIIASGGNVDPKIFAQAIGAI